MYKLQIKQQNKLKGNNGIIEKCFVERDLGWRRYKAYCG